MAKFKVKSVESERETKWGTVCDIIALTEDGAEITMSVWKKVKINDVLEGELGSYDTKYKKYKFKFKKSYESKKPVHTTSSSASSASDKDKRITMLSLLSTGASFEKDEGAIFAFMENSLNRIYNGQYILLCSPEQRKKIVTKYGSIEQARLIAYGLFKKPYLHLLTPEEAEKMLSEENNG